MTQPVEVVQGRTLTKEQGVPYTESKIEPDLQSWP
jgi:hypothetical protein